MKYNYPLFKVHVDVKQAMSNLKSVLESGFLNEGEQVTKFAEAMQSYLQHENAIPLNSCTSSIALALRLSGVKDGDEVIAPSMTCVASLTPIHEVGGKIVWSDINYATGNIDVEDVKKKITKKTKAVLCVNWAGLPCELKELYDLCKANNIKLIQDAAHSLGATYHGKHVCHYADFTCYSFQAIKHITCGDGGLLVCANSDDYERAKKLKWFGFDRNACKNEKGEWKGQRWAMDISEAGYKIYMNNIAASIGLSQINHIDRIVSAHRKNANLYAHAFAKNASVTPLLLPQNAHASYWVYTVIVNRNRDNIIEKLNKVGIAAGLVHVPCHDYTCFKDSLCKLPQTQYFHEHQISLPCGWWLNESDINNILDEL